jgi:hypothetical protein
MKYFKSINPMFQKKHRTCASFNHIQLLSSMGRHCAHQRWHSHFNWHCHYYPTWANLFFWSCAIQEFVALDVVQAKEFFYCNWYWDPIYKSLPLAIEIFGCLHKHADVFLHYYANAIQSLKGIKCLHLSTLVSFLHQKVSITIQKMQMSFILSRAIVVVGLVTPWFQPLQDTPPITTIDLLLAIDFWHVNMADLP